MCPAAVLAADAPAAGGAGLSGLGRPGRFFTRSHFRQNALDVHARLGHGTGADRRGKQGMNLEEPIWITGVGTANPLGHDYATVAANLLAGKSGVRPITGLEL